MNVEQNPRWIRWLLCVPAAGIAIVVMHLALTLAFSGNEERVSVFGIAIEGSGARWINAIWREGFMCFLEPWAFVAAAGVVAPAKKVPSIVLAAGVSLLSLAILGIQLSRGGPSLEPAAPMLRALIGIAGAVAGAVTAIRSKAETVQSTTRQMHTATLLTDGDWAQIDGRLCLVTEFVPMAKVKDGQITAIPGAPYASVQLTPERSERVKGFITHKTDFAMLWAAFNARAQVPATRLEKYGSRDLGIGLGSDEEVCVIWTRNNYSGVSRFLGRILPKLVVMVCAKGVFNSLIGRDDSGEMVKALAWIKWTPEVMKS